MTFRPKGFTLIEMLIVIGVVALLLTLVAPALSEAIKSADRITCASNMRQIAMGLLTYANDYDDRLPGNANDDAEFWWIRSVGDGADDGKQTLEGAVLRYIDEDRKVFQCPSYRTGRLPDAYPEDGGSKLLCHYAVPTLLAGLPAGVCQRSYYQYTDPDSGGLVNVDFAGVPLVVEPDVASLGAWNSSLAAWQPLYPTPPDGVPADTVMNGAFEQNDKLAYRRHLSGTTNIAFHDTHVEAIKFASTDVTAQNIFIVFTSEDATKTLHLGGVNHFNSWFDRSN